MPERRRGMRSLNGSAPRAFPFAEKGIGMGNSDSRLRERKDGVASRAANGSALPADVQKKPRGRDTSIEAYRVFLMFMICFIHSVSMGIAPNQRLLGGFLWAVCGFVFISGWFGINFSASKLLRLLATAVFCGGLAAAIGYFSGMPVSSWDVVRWAMRRWFVCAYMVLMLLAPFLNAAMDSPRGMRNGISAVVILAMWNWLSTSRAGIKFGPLTAGLGDYTFTMMVVVYIAARLIRKSCDGGGSVRASLFTAKRSVLAVLLLLALLVCLPHHFAIYSSPVALCMAVAAFFLFRHVKPGKRSGSAILFIAPSMLPVYLIHTNEVGFSAIKQIERFLDGKGVPAFVFIPLTALAVFSACLAIDMFRRGLCRLSGGFIKRISSVVDDLCNRIDMKICSALRGDGNAKS